MPTDILMPQLSPTMEEGRLAKWIAKEGDTVKAGQVIAEVETDKATMEVEAAEDGVLHAIIGEVGADIAVGVPIAVLRGAKEKVPADYQPEGRTAPKEEPSEPEAETALSTPEPAPAPQSVPLPQPTAKAGLLGRIKASPLARRLASQQGVNLSGVQGSGPKGRIQAKDLAAAASHSAGPIVRAADTSAKLTPMRKAIAARLTEAKQSVPHFYLNATVDMDALLDIRAQVNEGLAEKGVKLSVNDFILKACALALRDYPAANASFAGDSLVLYGNVDIAVAVAIEGGLITPVLQNADAKPLTAISAEVKQLAAAARAGKLKPEQYEGGSFSVSNLGMYGVESFSAIINPPQAAILACGAAHEALLVEGGEAIPATVMEMTLSVDHRVIDGALGAELLAAIKGYLEKPALLLI